MEMENNHMTDEEIFEMLKPKIEKNGIKTNAPTVVNIDAGMTYEESKKTDYAKEMQKAVAIAYRSGYGRGQKGRPFKMVIANRNPDSDSYFMGHKVIDKEPEIGDRVIMAKEHIVEHQIGVYWPHAGVCGKVIENIVRNLRIAWDSGVEDSAFGGWRIAPEYLKVIE